MADESPKSKPRRLKVVRPPADGHDLQRFFDPELETLLIGSILRFGAPAYYSARFLTPDDFTSDARRTIFAAIRQIGDETQPVIGAVGKHLSETGRIEVAGGFSGLADLHAKALEADLSGFAHSLRAKTLDRRAIALTKKLSELSKLGFSVSQADILAVTEELAALRICGVDSSDIAGLPGVGDTEETIAYIRQPELPSGSVVGITGDSGSGKSTLARAWIRDGNANGIPGLILDRESPRAIAIDCKNRLGLIDGPLLRWFGGWNGDVPGPDSPIVRAWVQRCNPKPIIVVDSVIAFLGGDENSAEVMRGFMNAARRLADLGATICMIHHDGKAESARDFRGSSDYKAAVDQAFHVSNISADAKLERLSLRCYKSRYGLSGSLVYHYAGGKFIRDDREAAPAETVAQQLTALLRTNPGIQTKAFEDLATKRGLGRNRARDFLENGLLSGVIRPESGGRNQRRYYLVEAGK